MHKRGLTVALVAVLTLIFVFGAVGVAFAQWTDLTMSILGDYGITEQQVANISDGFPDGSWRPYQAMPRNQFVKMAVDAYKIPLVTPATPTYSDVPTTDYYFAYIEGATAAGLTNGVGGGKFEPNSIVTREQAAAIIARWVSAENGYDLETMYTDADAAAILALYPDASSVSPSLTKEMAFAVDFGIVWGDASGLLAPKANMSRIQGAAMLIRSLDIIPMTEPVVPAKIELVSDDKAENLIGLTHQYTYKVTQADGSPAPGVLVDFDTLIAPWYVGNVEPEAALTDANGEATINLISTEVGIQRVSASAPGVAAVWSTKYWVALDEVYILDATRSSQNNAGTTHSWSARVLVFGPGPLSTSQSDWYNLYNPDADLARPMDADGIDAETVDAYCADDWTQYSDEVAWLADGYMGRSMADIPVFWQIRNVVDDDPDTTTDETVPSVGTIVAASEAGEIAADGQSAWAKTDADGLTSIDITSDVTGKTVVTAEANYEGNPYPWQLFDHQTNNDYEEHFYNWEDQPQDYAWATKTWIPHVIGGNDSPISPAFTEGNLGEEFLLTIHLEDVYGNAVSGRQVEWFMQGIGHFVTDDENTVTDPDDPTGNIDIDVTDANGEARLMVKSLKPGEQIIHAKVRDKGTDGHEGSYITYDAEVQWFDVNVATFDDITTHGEYDDLKTNEAWAKNTVGTTHDYTLHVYGLKLEYDPLLELNWGDVWWEWLDEYFTGLPANQTPFIDTDYAGSSYDGVIDWKDAAYFGGVLLCPPGYSESHKAGYPYDEDANGIIEAKNSNDIDERGTATENVQGVEVKLSFEGAYTSYDYNKDGYKEGFEGIPGIYLPLEGKDVTYKLVDNYLGTYFDEDGIHASVGSFTPATDVTDANGEANVTVTSNAKGPETVEATVDWEGNPHNGPELVKAYAKKIWVAKGVDKIVVSIDGVEVANNVDGEVNDAPVNPSVLWDPKLYYYAEKQMYYGGYVPNHANIQVHVYDEFGNDLPDYEVVYLLENVGGILHGSQSADDTYLPYAFFTDADTTNTTGTIDYDTNGTRPDHDEPMPSDDPYAPIVGDGGTGSFFFNQWLGATLVDPGFVFGDPYNGYVDSSDQNADMGQGYDQYTGVDIDGNFYNEVNPYWRGAGPFDGGPDFGYYGNLLTDGAKAWTMDGYFDYGEEGVTPNLLTGSNIDVQLAQLYLGDMHAKSIVKIMVYAPADGLVTDKAPIWEYQVHKVWQAPVATTITLAPDLREGMNPVWFGGMGPQYEDDSLGVIATVLDQFGNPMYDQDVDFHGVFQEGAASGDPTVAGDGYTNPATGLDYATGDDVNWGTDTTNYDGKAFASDSSPVWGVWDVYASAGDLESNVVTLQWGEDVDGDIYMHDSQKLHLRGGWGSPLHGLLFTIHAFTPDGTVANTGDTTAYDNDSYVDVATTVVFDYGDNVWVNFPASTNTDGAPNWVYNDDLSD